MLHAIGFKRTIQILIQHPALVLTSMFSNFTFGISTIKCCQKELKDGYLKISLPLSWGNFLLSCITLVSWTMYNNLTIHVDLTSIRFFELYYMGDIVFSIPLLFIGLITLLSLHCLPNCKAYCCPCYQNNCIPIIKETVLDPENPTELLDWPLAINIHDQFEEDDQAIPLQLQVSNEWQEIEPITAVKYITDNSSFTWSVKPDNEGSIHILGSP